MAEVQVRARVRESLSEVPPLAIVAASSMVLVTGLAFAVQEQQPAASIAIAGWVALGTALVAAAGLLAVALRRLPRGELDLVAGDGALRVAGRRVPFHAAFTRADRVEVERNRSTLVIEPAGEEAARRLAAALDAQPVLARFRLRADYLRFLVTIWAWLAVYGALCVIPASAPLGLLATAALVPLAAWVTLRAIPGTLVVTPAGLTLLRAGGVRRVPATAIEAVRTADDLHVLLHLDGGEELVLGELHEHPREPQPETTAPPAARLETALRGVLTSAAASREAR